MSHYEILGLERTATIDEIKARYKRLALIYHPDRNQSPDTTEKMKEIIEAYEVLSDDTRRAEYDRELEGRAKVDEFRAEYEAIGKQIKKCQHDIENRVRYLLTILPDIEKADQAEVLNPPSQPPLITTIVGYGTAEMLEQILAYYTKEELQIALAIEDEYEMDCIDHLSDVSPTNQKFKLLFSQFDMEERWALIESHVRSGSLLRRTFSTATHLDGLDKMFFDDGLYFAELDREISKLNALNTITSIPFVEALLGLRNDLFNFAKQQRKNKIPLIELQQTAEMQLLRDTLSLVKNLSPDAIIEYQSKTLQHTYSESSVLLRAIGLVVITAACVIVGGLIGIGIGMLAGAWTGPGAAITAVLGLIKGTMSGAALGLTIGTALTGVTAASVSGYLLFKPHQLKTDTESIISAGREYVIPKNQKTA